VSEPIRVAIVEDQDVIREGLALLIDATQGFRVTGRYGCMEEALPDLARRTPDVVLLDIGLPGMSGIQGIGVLRARYPALHLIALTVYDDDERIFQAICAGASGYLLKKTPPARLLENIREVMEGGAPMTPEVARRVLARFHDVGPAPPETTGLTAHEIRLLKLLVDGHNYKTAAAALGVSVNTVSFHMRNIYEKLHVHSKSEAVAKALRHGLAR
jgi:DNA-binding NarL/FixJ family response regulator